MGAVYLATALHTAIHACFTGSKVILSLLALDLGASQALIGVLIACYSLAPLALGLFSGRLADTIGMRVPMLLGAGFIAAAMLVGAQWQALSALFAVALLVGAGFVFFIVSVQNLIGVMPGNRARNYSVLTVGYSVSNFIGPLIAGYAIEYGGHAAAFMVFAAFTLFPLSVLAFKPGLTRVASPKPPQGSRNALELLRLAPLRQQILITGLSMAAWELYIFYMPIYGHGIGLTPSTIGIVLSTFAVATFLVRFALTWIVARTRVEHVLAGSMLAAGCICATFPLLADPRALIAASFMLGLALGCSQPLSLTLSFERSPPGRSGEVAGLRLIATNLARFAVPLLSGVFGAALGVGAVFWMNAVNLGVISLLARRTYR